MVDNVTLQLYGYPLPAEVIGQLVCRRRGVGNRGTEYVVYNLWNNTENLTVCYWPDIQLIRIQGSLPKFWKGDNIHPLAVTEMQAAIEHLTSSLRVPVYEASIMKLELFCTAVTPLPPTWYMQHIGIPPRYKRRYVEEDGIGTLYLKSGYREYVLYDKAAEMKLPAAQRPFWLRYETKLLKSPALQLKHDGQFLIQDLYNPIVYNHLANWLADSISRLPILPAESPPLVLPPCSTLKQWEALLASRHICIEHVLLEAQQQIRREREEIKQQLGGGTMTSKEAASRRKNADRQQAWISKAVRNCPPNEAMQEMVCLLKAAAHHYVSQ